MYLNQAGYTPFHTGIFRGYYHFKDTGKFLHSIGADIDAPNDVIEQLDYELNISFKTDFRFFSKQLGISPLLSAIEYVDMIEWMIPLVKNINQTNEVTCSVVYDMISMKWSFVNKFLYQLQIIFLII